jgi:hypothetical protein
MIKHGAFYHFADNNPAQRSNTQLRGRTLLIDELQPASDPFAIQQFDLLFYLTGGFDRMDSALCRIDGRLRFPDWNWVSANRSNEFVARNNGIIAKLKTDDSQGGQIGTLERNTDSRTETWEFKYERASAVWTPWEIDITVADRDNETTLYRSVQFQRSVINHEVDRSEFALDRLGVIHGDLIRDQRANVQYAYTVPSSAHSLAQPTSDEDQGIPFYIVLNIAVWVFAIAAYAWWQWRKKVPHIST